MKWDSFTLLFLSMYNASSHETTIFNFDMSLQLIEHHGGHPLNLSGMTAGCKNTSNDTIKD